MQTTVEDIRSWGIAGAGGAGFPTYVKAGSKAEIVILNAAECEPLLHKDKELLRNYADAVIEGMMIMISLTGAKKAIIGIKEKYTDVINFITPKLPNNFSICRMGDYYPAGDEFVLVYDSTGRVIPPGGLPIQVGCVVNNVETMLNLGLKKPVIEKYLTIAGGVKNPMTIKVPIGVTFRECLEIAGGALDEKFAVIEGGIMMGKYTQNIDSVVTKTTGGLIVLPYDHPIAKRYRRDETSVMRIGKAACDQCSFCTEYCPRYLLGHPIQPHLAMRSLALAAPSDSAIIGTLYCCECNLCSFYSCPEDLDPKNVCVSNKTRLRKANAKWNQLSPIKPHPLNAARRAPIKRLFTKLKLGDFVNKGSLTTCEKDFKKVRIALRQGVGVPPEPVVKPGDKVNAGDIIALPDKDKLGLPLHASISGVVKAISGEIIIES